MDGHCGPSVPLCEFEGTITPSEVPCNLLKAPAKCEKKAVIYHSDSLCTPSYPIVTGRYQLSVNGNVHSKEKRFVVCRLIYHPPKIDLSTSPVPNGHLCAPLPLQGAEKWFPELVPSLLEKYCDRLKKKIYESEPTLKENYIAESKSYEFVPWAKTDTVRNYTEDGWRRFVKENTEGCEKELKNGQRVDRTPSVKKDKEAQDYFEKLFSQELTKQGNPKHTWACCKDDSKVKDNFNP